MNELTELFWDEHFRNKKPQDLSNLRLRVFNWLNEDNFGGFGIDGDRFWIEKTCSRATLPNYIYAYMNKWAKKKGYTSIYAE
jgi:hypothetical protein